METAQQSPAPGSLSWRLSSHPITLLTFLFFRVCMSPNHKHKHYRHYHYHYHHYHTITSPTQEPS